MSPPLLILYSFSNYLMLFLGGWGGCFSDPFAWGCGGEWSFQLHQPQEGPDGPQPWLCSLEVTAVKHHRGCDLMAGAQPRQDLVWDGSMELPAQHQSAGMVARVLLPCLSTSPSSGHQPLQARVDPSPVRKNTSARLGLVDLINCIESFTGGKAKHPPPSS